MTLQEIQDLVVSCDPNAGHYESAYRDKVAYTVWFEKSTLDYMGDNAHMGGIQFQIDRFTKQEGDSIAAAIENTLESRDDVAYQHLTDYEIDTGYIHHIFDCEGF